MDFITHALVGAGAARIGSPKREWIPQLSLAGILGGELQDADPWLYLIDPSYYGKYHRVTTHNLWALMLIALACAGIAWWVTRVRPWRRFGWFVTDNLPRPDSPEPPIDHAPWRWFFLVAMISAYLHLLYDTFTGFGNIQPLWPWSAWDPSLAAVSSFDAVILAVTLGWNVSMRYFTLARKAEIRLTAVYALAMALYVGGRYLWCESTVW